MLCGHFPGGSSLELCGQFLGSPSLEQAWKCGWRSSVLQGLLEGRLSSKLPLTMSCHCRYLTRVNSSLPTAALGEVEVVIVLLMGHHYQLGPQRTLRLTGKDHSASELPRGILFGPFLSHQVFSTRVVTLKGPGWTVVSSCPLVTSCIIITPSQASSFTSCLVLAEPSDVPERPRGLDDSGYPHGHQRPDQERKELAGGLLPEGGA